MTVGPDYDKYIQINARRRRAVILRYSRCVDYQPFGPPTVYNIDSTRRFRILLPYLFGPGTDSISLLILFFLLLLGRSFSKKAKAPSFPVPSI